MKFYSPSKNAFYASEFEPEYRAAGNWPDDLREVSTNVYATTLAVISNGGVLQPDADGNPVTVAPPGPTLAQIQTNAIRRIDADVDAIYGAVIGNRQSEYDAAESDATAYKAANYGGAVPANVQSWATAKKWTAKQAADDILATAANWRAAQADIRANRLARKEDVRAAVSAEEVDNVLAAWSAYVAAKRAALGA